MKIIIFGGTGFVGEYLCDELVQNKNNQIIAVHNSESTDKKTDNIFYEKIDLDGDCDVLKRIFPQTEIIIFAIQPDEARMKKIVKALEEAKDLKKIVYLSTLLVYPDSGEKQDENVMPEALTDYEKKKCIEEKILEDFIKDKDIKLCITRLANVYGDIKNRGIINYIFLHLIENNLLSLNGDGKNIRDYIFVEDVARLINFLVSFDQKSKKEIYNICTGSGSSIISLIDKIENITKEKIDFDKKEPIEEKKSVVGDNGKILLASKLQINYDLEKGLKKTYNNYLNYYK